MFTVGCDRTTSCRQMLGTSRAFTSYSKQKLPVTSLVTTASCSFTRSAITNVPVPFDFCQLSVNERHLVNIDPKRCQLGTASECNHLKIITRGASQEQLQHRAHAGGRRGAQGSLRCTVAAAVQPEMVPHLLHDKDRPSGKSRAGAREYGL